MPKLLILSHVFPPDNASVGQHMADVAAEMRRRGWDVVVLAGARDFDDPSKSYRSAILADGTRVIRLPLSSFGKTTLARRVVAAALFTAQAAVRVLFGRKPDLLLVSNAPPFAPIIGPMGRRLRRIPYVYWVMDINPDQLVASGVLAENSWVARAWRRLNRRVYRRARQILVLDRFMYVRAMRQGAPEHKLLIVPPWSHDEHLAATPAEVVAFRKSHGVDGRIVVMYSGNHAASHPLTTLLDAAARLEGDERFVFMFIGGGAGKREIEARRLRNVLSLPYQPLEHLGASLRAADIHLITMGDPLVGIVHVSKIYGIMSVARPFIFVGPAESHVADLALETGSGWVLRHGDVDGALAILEKAAASPATLAEMGSAGRSLIDDLLGQEQLRSAFCDILEKSAAPRK